MAANYASTSIGYDVTFEFNEFNQPRIRSEIETVKNIILFILFARPGQYPSLPHIGLDLETKLYGFYDELDVNELKQQLSQQCSELNVYFNSGAVEFKKTKYRNKPSLMIHIEGNELFPDKYMKDHVGDSKAYLIGITLDEMNKMIYNINERV